MASQGVREEISTHHPSAVMCNAMRRGLTIEANDGSGVFHVFFSSELCRGEFMIVRSLKKPRPLLGGACRCLV